MDIDQAHAWLMAGPWTLDGGMSNVLEQEGEDLAGMLWSARLLRDNPDAIRRAHRTYIEAGAQIITTASYQASHQGFAAAGIGPEEADDLLRLSIGLAREAAAGTDVKIAASVGSYGAVLTGGEEYHGRFEVSVDELAEFHHERLSVLVDEAPDLLAFETIPDAVEAAAIVQALDALPPMPSWISFSCNGPETTCADQSILEAFRIAASSRSVVAVGVNCTAPEFLLPLLEAMSAESDMPLVAYPNHGREWLGDAMEWAGDGDGDLPPAAVQDWVRAGAMLVGGCCGVGPDAISVAAATLAKLRA